MGELTTAHYDALRDRVVIRLVSGVEIGFALADAEGLERASAEDLQEIGVEAFGLGIHFPRLDADLYVPALPRGLLGSRKWMAARRAAAGGHNRGTAGSATSRERGRRARTRKAAQAGEG